MSDNEAERQREALEMVWECPRCGAQMGQVPPMRLISPKCSSGHPKAEMEQKQAGRWMRQWEDATDAR